MTPGLDALPITLHVGAFDLDGEGDSWRCEVLGEGTDLAGNPVPIEVAIQTLIQDGSVSYTEKHDNATLPIHVLLSGPDAEALDAGAAALFAELGHPNTLTYTGPQALLPVAWDVVNSHLDRNSDDLAEARGERYYTISFSVLPFRRATEETITEALPAAGIDSETVSDGTSATGWSGFPGPVTVVSDAVHVEAAPLGVPQGFRLTLLETVDTSDTPYIVVDWKATAYPVLPQLEARASGSAESPSPAHDPRDMLPRIAQTESPDRAGYMRTWFLAGDSSLPFLRFDTIVEWVGGRPPAVLVFQIANVDRTDTPPGVGRQQYRSIAIEGSARTPGAIAIEHESNALGDVRAYFWPDDGSGYIPSTRQFQTAGGDNPDTDAVSGVKTGDIRSVAYVVEIPTKRLIAGGHRLDARLKAASSLTATLTWTATTVINGVDLGPTITGSRAIPLTTGYAFIPLGRLVLPTRDVDPAGEGAVVRLTISAAGSGAVTLDDAWIYNRQVGRLLAIPCGSGTPSSGGPSNRVFIEPATAATPRPLVRRGFAEDRSDSFHPPGLGSWQFPEFPPPRVNILIITTGTADAKVSFRHFKRLAG